MKVQVGRYSHEPLEYDKAAQDIYDAREYVKAGAHQGWKQQLSGLVLQWKNSQRREKGCLTAFLFRVVTVWISISLHQKLRTPLPSKRNHRQLYT